MAEEDAKRVFDWLPEGCEVLADGEYDAIVMGTGLKECVISGLLSVHGKKVLHVDRNNYYGGDCASLNLTNLYSKFKAGEVPSYLGANRDYNVDLIPKFIMATGNLTKMLLHTKVTRYLEFKQISGSYVFRNDSKGGKVYKVPASPEEALASKLMGLFEKRRFRNFLIYCDQFNEKDSKTFQNRDLTKMTMKQLYEDFGLVPETHEFISHAMCLEISEDHMGQPALPTILALKVYMDSMARYGTSPYIYPLYGLGGLPEGFSRLCAIHGGTFMLNQDVDEITYDANGLANGIKAGNQLARAKMIIGDPSYFPKDKVRATGQVVRCICFLNHPIPNTDDRDSVQIIIPGPQVGRKNDIFVCCLSHNHQVSAQGIYVAIVSTKVENNDPEKEILPGMRLLGNILQRFTTVSTSFEPVDSGEETRTFISSSFDASSHFENDVDDMLSLYERVTGEKLDMTIKADKLEEDY